MIKRKHIGCYELGPAQVDLYFTAGYGGSFLSKPAIGKLAEIQVGFGGGVWGTVVSVLMHEAMEFSMMQTGCRFSPNPDYGNENAGYTFHMNHTQFSEVGARTGEFMAACLPGLAKEHNKWVRKAKRRKI